MGSGMTSMKDVSLLLGRASTIHTERDLRSINSGPPGLVNMLDKKEIYPKDIPMSCNSLILYTAGCPMLGNPAVNQPNGAACCRITIFPFLPLGPWAVLLSI
jgi:hypothetical protein